MIITCPSVYLFLLALFACFFSFLILSFIAAITKAFSLCDRFTNSEGFQWNL